MPKLESECEAWVTPSARVSWELLPLCTGLSQLLASCHLCLCLQKAAWRPVTSRAVS